MVVYILMVVGVIALTCAYILSYIRKLKLEIETLKTSRDYWQGRSMELIDETWKLSAELRKYTEWGRSIELSGGDDTN